MTTRLGILPQTQRGMEYLGALFCKKIKLFTFGGIDFFLNSSVLIIPVILVVTDNINLAIGIYVLGVAASILLHEMGHALGGYLVGNPATEICLIACGGYTVFSRIPGVTAKDALMSIAGPMANGLVCILVIGFERAVWGGSFGEWAHLLFSELLGSDLFVEEWPMSFVLLNAIAIVNAYMLVFNLLPAFPLDGGRIFRWLSGCFLPSQKAAFTTMLVARMLACLIVLRSLATDLIAEFNPYNLAIMGLIAGWIWCGSKMELWRTKLYCAAEAGSPAAISELRHLFGEEAVPAIIAEGRGRAMNGARKFCELLVMTSPHRRKP